MTRQTGTKFTNRCSPPTPLSSSTSWPHRSSDRIGKGKNNHPNKIFGYEGNGLREFFNAIPGCFIINGDRHWQYHSIDPNTGLNEFGSGSASDVHAGGFKMEMQEKWQPFLRIKGGYLSVEINQKSATVRHHNVDVKLVNEAQIAAPE